MNNLIIPKNSPELVIIPSNNKGTGFLRNTYDIRFLSGIIKEQEFLFVIDQAAKINA